MFNATGGSAKRMMVAVNQMFLLDSAYARRAEKAENQCRSVKERYERRNASRRTAECGHAQCPSDSLRPYVCPTAIAGCADRMSIR